MEFFVMMPSAADFRGVREHIRKAVNIARGTALFADEFAIAGNISKQIEDGIRQSDACIIDITEWNPNVIWEMGFAQALGKAIIILALHKKYLFFDTDKIRAIIYYDNDDANFKFR